MRWTPPERPEGPDCAACGVRPHDPGCWWCSVCDTEWGTKSPERERVYDRQRVHPSQAQRILHDLKLAFTNRIRRKRGASPLMLRYGNE